MAWNWQAADWPYFSYNEDLLEPLERAFMLHAGTSMGILRHISLAERDEIRIELVSQEALKTSAIEGQYLDRESVQSSLRQQFGMPQELSAKGQKPKPAEQGISQMMANATINADTALDHDTLFSWHKMVMHGDRQLETIGAYRQHAQDMQIVSHRLDRPTVHFQAPPSVQVHSEMDRFIHWFNSTAPSGETPLPALTRAGIAHLYFETIHPFEDGNGRIGRVLCEKVLAQHLGAPSLIALSYTIERNRKAYYAKLEASNHSNMISDWLVYFASTILEAQRVTLARIEFSLAKSKFYSSFAHLMNARQTKVIARMFAQGVDGFKGGLSAENYISITQTSRATATRDLADLVTIGALIATGERRYTRYRLNVLAG